MATWLRYTASLFSLLTLLIIPDYCTCIIDVSDNVTSRNSTLDNVTSQITASDNVTTSSRYHLCTFDCDLQCVSNAMSAIFIVGVIANLCVISRVLLDRKLHEPTFVVIGGLALADFFLLSSLIIVKLSDYYHVATCSHPDMDVYRQFHHATMYLWLLSWASSSFHVVAMAFTRCMLLLIYPPRTPRWLSVKATVVISALIWMGSILMPTPLLVSYADDNVVEHHIRTVLYTSIVVVCYAVPVLLMLVLHLVKLRGISQVLSSNPTEFTVTMSKMVMIVVLLFVFLPLPHVVHVSLTLQKHDFLFTTGYTVFQVIGELLFLLNSSVNPFIYAFMSRQFRNSLRRAIRRSRRRCRCVPRKEHDGYRDARLIGTSVSQTHVQESRKHSSYQFSTELNQTSVL